jgi:Na+/melibiose symporter-like transporter
MPASASFALGISSGLNLSSPSSEKEYNKILGEITLSPNKRKKLNKSRVLLATMERISLILNLEKKTLYKPNTGGHMFVFIALLLACIGIFAGSAVGLYAVLELWFGLGMTYAECCVMAAVLFITAVILMFKDARELEED